jgi:class 3 adenylate cyclase
VQQQLTVFFSDIANSTRLYQQTGDVNAHDQIVGCLSSLRDIVEAHDGKLLRTVGDAVLASFEHCGNAFHAAVVAQRQQSQSQLRIRVGFHTGVVIPDGGDVYGNAVNIAARVAAFANPDEIYTTGDSMEQLPTELRKNGKFLDNITFKGLENPLPVYRIHWSNLPPSMQNADTRILTALNNSARFKSDFHLLVNFGSRTISVTATNPTVKIGRSLENDIQIDSDSTSRFHASIEFVRGRFVLNDSSTNGSYIVRPGQTSMFVRREAVLLDHTGFIGAGWLPERSDPQCILFQSIRNA